MKNIKGLIGNTFRDKPERIGNGRPKGLKNRSTVVKYILEMKCDTPEEIYSKLKKTFPALPKKMTVEEVMTIKQVQLAIERNDTAAYRAIMDNAYKPHTQEIGIQNDRPVIQVIDMEMVQNNYNGNQGDDSIQEDQ